MVTTTNLKSTSLCPTCGGTLWCCDRDVGGGGSEDDEYSLICDNCGVINREVIHDSEKLSDEDWKRFGDTNKCPFCGKGPGAHDRPTPEKYW